MLEILGPSVDCGKVVQELNWKRMELSTAREEQLLVKEEVEDVQEGSFSPIPNTVQERGRCRSDRVRPNTSKESQAWVETTSVSQTFTLGL